MAWKRKQPSTPQGRATPKQAVAAPAPPAGEALINDLVSDAAVLGELSRAFADLDDPLPTRRPTIVIGTGTDASDVGNVRGEAAAVTSPDSSRSERAVTGSSSHTIAIGGDDLPDAVYLDDELGRDSSDPGLVIIDDDASGDAVPAHVASGRGIEPRLRQRRIGIKRAETRRRLWWVGLGGIVLVVVIAVLALLGSPLFAVRDVVLTGNVYADPDELAVVIEQLEGTPVLRVDTAAVEAQLEAIAWVERARVRTDFPNAASIEIVERVPVAAMMGADASVRVLDDEGRVLALVDGQPVALVWFSGMGTLDVAPGQFASVGYASAASLVTKLTPNIRERVDSIIVTPDGSDLVVMLTSNAGPIEVRFGSAIGDNDQIEKLVRLERTLEDTSDRLVTVIDVSTSEVTVR